MNIGSFDVAIANSKLFYAEKYKKASLSDLNMFKNVLGAEVQVSSDGRVATIIVNGQRTDLTVIGQ